MATRLATASRRRYRWTDFIELDEDDRRELIDGQLLEVDVPTKIHEWVVAFVAAMLFNWSRAKGGLVLASGYRIRISDSRGVMPDVQFFRKGRGRLAGERGLESGAPDLVVEVVSPTSVRYDRVVKLRWYAKIGVPEYWIIDPQEQILERLLLDGERFRIAESLVAPARFAPDSFPGLSIQLAELFTLADR